jgi:hypothetical protein
VAWLENNGGLIFLLIVFVTPARAQGLNDSDNLGRITR